MRRWWREKDYLEIIPEKKIGPEMSLEENVEMIFKEVTGEQCL